MHLTKLLLNNDFNDLFIRVISEKQIYMSFFGGIIIF